MKKIFLTATVALVLMSCGSSKEATSESGSKSNGTTKALTNMAATQLLSTLSKKSSMDDISKLFGLLDKNKDKSVSEEEAVGDVSTNFGALDSDKNGGLNLKELGGLLAFLK